MRRTTGGALPRLGLASIKTTLMSRWSVAHFVLSLSASAHALLQSALVRTIALTVALSGLSALSCAATASAATASAAEASFEEVGGELFGDVSDLRESSVAETGWSSATTRLQIACRAGAGISEWQSEGCTFDPDEAPGAYCDARGATMIAPPRVRQIAAETIARTPTPPCGEFFGQAIAADRHSPLHTNPPLANVDPALLASILPVPRSTLVEILAKLDRGDRRADGVSRGIDRPPTTG